MSDEIKFIRNFSGFSGCKIKLYSRGGSNFVRKISASRRYNGRLKRQMEKQIWFYETLVFDNVKTPRVLGSGMEGELFFFDMEYIHGINLIEHVLTSPLEELKNIASIIIKILERMESTVAEEDIFVGPMVNEKLEAIENKIVGGVPGSDLIRSNLQELILKKTFCHGDMTFENIIYDRESGNYYLIDFLDSFVEHYFFDITNLFRDLEGGWYLLRNPDIDKKIMSIKMNFIKDYLWDNYLGDKGYAKYHSALLKLCLARTLPYAEGENLERISKMLERLNSLK